MSTMLHSFLKWAKDPFGKRDVLDKHTTLINELYAAQATAKKTTDLYAARNPRARRVRVMGGVNALDRALLGNQGTTKE